MDDQERRLVAIISACSFPPWQLVTRWDDNRPYLQVRDPKGICNVTGEPKPWAGRKWFLSYHMTETEVVKTALKAVVSAVEHETLENFKYLGHSIFDPHLSVNALLAARKMYVLDGRTEEPYSETVNQQPEIVTAEIDWQMDAASR